MTIEETSGRVAAPANAVELEIGPRIRALGGLRVNRVWPTPRRRLIGPFIFFDHLQPTEMPPGDGLDVPPHPHTGLATVTYLFAGAIMHRDSLGYRQAIRPGEVNWMTAGRGIVHSERSPDEERARASSIHGIQAWVALPDGAEDCEPTFEHHSAASVPVVTVPNGTVRLIAGEAFGARSPVATRSALFYAEANLGPGAVLDIPAALGQRAVYVVSGAITIDGCPHASGRLLVLRDGARAEARAAMPVTLMLIGGQRWSSERYIDWNFVASSPERIEAAKREWRERRFPVVPGDDGYMPLPGTIAPAKADAK